MSATAENDAPKAAPAPNSSPEQDDWLHATLGLDTGAYGGTGDDEPEAGGIFSSIGKAASSVGHTIGKAATTVAHGVGDVIDGVKKIFSGPPPVPRAELGPAQTTRAGKLLAKMPPEDQIKVQAILDKAAPSEKKYLQKALASAHSAAEIDSFYKQIQGKDAAWLEKNLHVVGDSDGKGIKQQWHDSCGPTTVQAMKAELDPIYALKLRQQAKDVTKADDDKPTAMNPDMAEEQRKMLVDNGGIAVKRDNETDGKGMGLTAALNGQKATTGLDFEIKGVDDTNVDAELGEIDTSIASGLPVPLRVGNGPKGHFVLVTGVDPGPPRRYSIHDPYDGKIVVVTDKQIKDKTFDIAGWHKVTHIYKPSATPEPAS